MFGCDLGQVLTFNRNRLSAHLSAGLKNAVISNATGKGDPAEAVRVLDDAFSGVVDVDFLGSATKPYENSKNPDDVKIGKFCTMPVKLRFADKESRIYFENSARSLGAGRAVQSLPPAIRTDMTKVGDGFRKQYPDLVIFLRPDSRTLSYKVLAKKHGAAKWEELGFPVPINSRIMLPNFRTDSEDPAGDATKSGDASSSEKVSEGQGLFD